LRKFSGGYKNRTGKFKIFTFIRISCRGSVCQNFTKLQEGGLEGMGGCSTEGKIEIETKTGNCLSWRKSK